MSLEFLMMQTEKNMNMNQNDTMNKNKSKRDRFMEMGSLLLDVYHSQQGSMDGR